MPVEELLANLFPGETGAARLRLLGLLTIIYALQGDGEPVTAARIAALTGQSVSQIRRQLHALGTLNLVERTRMEGRPSRGEAWRFSVKKNAETGRLVDATSRSAARFAGR